MKKSSLIAIVLIGFSVNMFAQATASATATATIVAAITLTNVDDMNFGNVAVVGAGTVILGTNSGRTPSGGVTLPAAAGIVSAASFDVTGEPDATYDITIPTTDYIITRLTGTETMIVNDFVSDPAAGSNGQLDGTGAQIILVGATLNVDAAQVPGVYTNATGFDVTVNYN